MVLPIFFVDISKKFGARTAKPSKNLRNQRLLGSQKTKISFGRKSQYIILNSMCQKH